MHSLRASVVKGQQPNTFTVLLKNNVVTAIYLVDGSDFVFISLHIRILLALNDNYLQVIASLNQQRGQFLHAQALLYDMEVL